MTTSSKTNMKPKLSKTGTTNKSNAVDGTTKILK